MDAKLRADLTKGKALLQELAQSYFATAAEVCRAEVLFDHVLALPEKAPDVVSKMGYRQCMQTLSDLTQTGVDDYIKTLATEYAFPPEVDRSGEIDHDAEIKEAQTAIQELEKMLQEARSRESFWHLRKVAKEKEAPGA